MIDTIQSVHLPAIVFTDLDGTLLDHNTYDWAPAKDALHRLAALNVPVVFNTSKTRAELEYWREVTGNKHPFIVENGSAVLIPRHYPENIGASDNCEAIELGVKRDDILLWLKEQADVYGDKFTHFAQLDVDGLIALTDLPRKQAQLALQREFSEAVHWRGDEASRDQFISLARNSGYRVLIGGRFLHILGNTDKGKASRLLVDRLSTMERAFMTGAVGENDNQAVTCIACGDGQNDIDMLEWADIAIVIRSPKQAPPLVHNPHKIVSSKIGPEGWAEVFNELNFIR